MCRVNCWINSVALSVGMAVFGLACPVDAQTNTPNNDVKLPNGQLRPAAGFNWLSNEPNDFRVRWQPGLAHPTLPNLVSGTNAPVFVPAQGYRWANNLPNDFSVVRITTVGPTDEAIGRAIVKVLAAAIADAASKPNVDDDLLTTILRQSAKIGRDQLIESAVEDVFPTLTQTDLRTVRNAICLAVDGNLSEASWNRSRARDEMLATLRGRDPNLATATQVADFVQQVIKARQN